MFQDSCNNTSNTYINGFTLMEMIVAILFFAITVTCLSLPFSQSIKLAVNEQDSVDVNTLARRYLKSIEADWQFQNAYDQGIVPAITDQDNSFGKYVVDVSTQDLGQNFSSTVTVRRVTVIYKDKQDNTLMELFSDFDRPESAIR